MYMYTTIDISVLHVLQQYYRTNYKTIWKRFSERTCFRDFKSLKSSPTHYFKADSYSKKFVLSWKKSSPSLRRQTISLSSKNVSVIVIQNLHSTEVTNIVVPFKSMRTFQPYIHVGLFLLYTYLVCTKFRRWHAIFLSLSLKINPIFDW